MNTENQDQKADSGSKPALDIRFFGVGGAGCRIVEQIAGTGIAPGSFYAADTNGQDLAGHRNAQRVLIGAKMMRGLGAGGDMELATAATEADGLELSRLFTGADIVILVAGLGGGTGGGAGPVLARMARQTGALVLAFAVTPFDCEGKKRQRQAMQAMRQLKASVDGTINLPNQHLLKLAPEGASLQEVFQSGNTWIQEGIRGVWRMLARPGLITVDFAELKNCLRGRHSEGALSSSKAAGVDRAKTVAESLLACPLLGNAEALRKADTVIVNIAGNARLGLPEVDQVITRVRQCCDKANVILGATCDDQLGESLEVTLIATTRQTEQEQALQVEERTNPRFGATRSNEGPGLMGLEINPLEGVSAERPRPGLVAPAPDLSAEQTGKLLKQQAHDDNRIRKNLPQLLQGQLPLQIISRGRFEKSEPTVHHGEDLDKPTYMRRSISLN
jgi:cell division protein FtsZ